MFYESLFEQNPKSFMALKWCVEHGVFSAKKSESMLKVMCFCFCFTLRNYLFVKKK